MIELEKLRPQVEEILYGLTWRKWVHRGSIEAETQEQKDQNVDLAKEGKHCGPCLNLNGCLFPKDNIPQQPLHPKCHCTKKNVTQPIPGKTAFAECPEGKLIVYVFVKDPVKRKFFESNGYYIEDAAYMILEYEKQAIEKYVNGEFKLGLLDKYGQRITVRMELPRRIGYESSPFSYKTGWLVYANGKIKCTTPATNLDRE